MNKETGSQWLVFLTLLAGTSVVLAPIVGISWRLFRWGAGW